MPAADVQVRDWRERFRKHPLAAKVVTGLRTRSSEIWQRTFDLLQRESPEYRNAVDEEFTKESRGHCGELLNSITQIAAPKPARTETDPFAFVRTHAQWRARHHVPLTASLQAYRLAHKTYWEISREALLRQDSRQEALLSLTMLSDFWLEFFDYMGVVLAEAHAVEERLSVAHNTQAYTSLIDDLLKGRPIRDIQARRLSTVCGILPGAPIAIAIARALPSPTGKQIDVEVALRSFVRLVEEAVPSAVFGRLVDIRNDEVVLILCSPADTARAFAKALRRHGFGKRAEKGLGAGVGVGLDTAEVAGLPESLEQARLALEPTSAARPLIHFADLDLTEFLIRHADHRALRLIPEPARQLLHVDGGTPGELLRTLRAFTDCSLNVKQTARRLGVHTNTVYFRLNRINKLTGIDPRTFSGALLLLTACHLLDNHPER